MIVIGAPVVLPLNNPVLMPGISSSLRGVVPFAPGLRLSMSVLKSSIANGNPAGQPSMVSPTHSPCDSPKICRRNMRPKLFTVFYLRMLMRLLVNPFIS